MRRLTGSLFLSAVILATAGLAAACGGSHSGAIASFSPSRTASLPSRSATPSPSLSASALPSHSASAPAAAAPTVTRTATTTATATAPARTAQPSSAAASAGDQNSAVIWPWVLLGVLVVIGIAVLISRAARRRSRAAGGWRSRVIDAYAKGSALHDAMSVAEVPGALAAADAGTRWSDIQRRADDLTQTLYELRESAPGEQDRALVADSLTALQVVRSAMDAERAPVEAGAQEAEVVRSRLSSFEASLRALRGPDGGPL